MESSERGDSPPQKKRRRIANACLQCKQKKKRCDGSVPQCMSCVERRLTCTYVGVRRRGRGKAKTYLESLEARVAELEASMHHSANIPVGTDNSNTAGAGPKSADSVSKSFDNETQPTISGRLVYGESGATFPEPTRPSGDREKMQSALRERLFAMLPEQTTLAYIRLEAKHSPFTTQVFIQLPAKVHLESLFAAGFDDLNCTLPLFDTPILMGLLEEHLSNPTLPKGNYPERWAILNAAIAVAMQVRAARGSHSEMMGLSFHFFKNAFSMYPAIATRGTDILALEALLAMAIYMQGLSDTKTTSVLVSAAARLSLTLGLHQNPFYLGKNPPAANYHRHMKAFWVAYILDKDISIRTGLPSTFDDDAITLDHPGPDLVMPASSTSGTGLENNIPSAASFFQMRVRLAMIDSKVEKQLRLFSKSASGQNATKILTLVAELDNQLETWKENLPSHLRPAHQPITWSEIPPATREPIISLHFAYYRTLGQIHGFAAAKLKQVADDITSPTRIGNIKFSIITQAFAAAQIISLLQYFPWQQPGHLWYLLYYPVAACITLVATILQYQTDVQARPCARDIGELVKFLKRIQHEKTLEVQPLLDLCSELESLALRTIENTAHGKDSTMLTSLSESSDSGFSSACGQNLDVFSYPSGRTISSMQLTCGLMGNMPNLRSIATKTFSDLVPNVQISLSSSASLLAPLSLDSEVYGLTFT
ncbi:fungal-specific transcription factor domain-containing protein [Aspergillus granulosus]|uniref:Fungal-specific transcription factor domain-containing protein n=1 Tax=Aspergillus granulosus TaxID=176169 RepID=A0ABR4HFJ5_9EURO